MAGLRRLVRDFCRCERGLTFIEYGLLLSLLALGLFGLWGAIGGMVEANFLSVNSDLQSVSG